MRGITALVLTCLAGLTGANVIHEWNNFLQAHMIKEKIGSNVSTAGIMSPTNDTQRSVQMSITPALQSHQKG
jgi:hypothetical protein